MSKHQITTKSILEQTDWTPDPLLAPQTPWQGDKPITREQKEAGFVKAFVGGKK